MAKTNGNGEKVKSMILAAGAAVCSLNARWQWKKKWRFVLKRDMRRFNYMDRSSSLPHGQIHDMEGEIEIGDTMKNPVFKEGGKLKKFDCVVANPMWNQDKDSLP